MFEIYFIQRLGNVSTLFNIGFWACIFAIILILIVGFFLAVDNDMYVDDLKEAVGRSKKYINRFLLWFAFFTAGAVLCPTEKEILAIYGVGGTIDYIKSNDKAKQLPDKCIDALTRYVDSIEPENKDKKD